MSPRKTFKDPFKYIVGTDISQTDYDNILTKIADWFVESRVTEEPALLARQLLQECLQGITREGKPWFAAASSSLASRVRVKCQYDIEKMEPLRMASPAQKAKKAKERMKLVIKKAAEKEDTLLPDEIRRELQGAAKYGDDPNLYFTQAEHRSWEELKSGYMEQFPELSTVNAVAELAMLCDLHIQWERIRMRQNKGQRIDADLLQSLTKQMADLKKMLGIHPDQVKNRNKGKEELTVGAAVSRLDALNWTELRERFWIEELIQLWMMYHTPKADGNGYQLDEVGLYGLTKSKVVDCPKCSTKHFGGLDIVEITKYLETKGWIVPLNDAEAAYVEQANAVEAPVEIHGTEDPNTTSTDPR